MRKSKIGIIVSGIVVLGMIAGCPSLAYAGLQQGSGKDGRPMLPIPDRLAKARARLANKKGNTPSAAPQKTGPPVKGLPPHALLRRRPGMRPLGGRQGMPPFFHRPHPMQTRQGEAAAGSKKGP